jgi:hypothetical protein
MLKTILQSVGMSARQAASLSLEVALMSADLNAPTDWIVKCGDGYVSGRLHDDDYLTTDIAKAMPMSEEVADALAEYLAVPCDCGTDECEYPVALPSAKLHAPGATKH